MKDDLDVIQWLFDTEVFTKALNWPVDVDSLVAAKLALDEAVTLKAPASDVADAYEKFAAAIGPTVMASLLQGDDAFPEVNHFDGLTPPSPGKVTLYVDPFGGRVLADVPTAHGMPPEFDVA